MSAIDDYNRYLAASGAGMDAAGRPVFTGRWSMYSSPAESAAQMGTLKELERRAANENAREMRIRQLMDDLKQRELAMGLGPGTIRLATQPLDTANSSYSVDARRIYGS